MANSAQPNRFQFILNIRGVITEVLANAPENWLNNTIKFTRSPMYQGLFRGETDPVKFVTYAAFLLRKELYKTGIMSNVKLFIKMLNPYNWLYRTIYSGKLDFSTVDDQADTFTITTISDDFSVQINANDTTDYAFDLDVPEAINLELTPIVLKEQATLIPGRPPDGNVHSDYFPPIQVAANQQNSVNFSVQSTNYEQFREPNYSQLDHYFFISRVNGKLLLKGVLQCNVINVGPNPPEQVKMYIINNSGVIRLHLIDQFASGATQVTVNIDKAIDVTIGERLFLYIEQVNDETSQTGIDIVGGTIDLAYDTISPPTMCKALPASYLFGQLLQAMNTNTNSGPNQPVNNKTDLLNGELKDLVLTSSDSIRLALGSLFNQDNTLFPGSYKVVQTPVSYNGASYTLGQTFSFVSGVNFFSGTGKVEKTVSGIVGNVYNPGDTLQAGGVYLAGGASIIYNGLTVEVGNTFKYVLGQDTFTGTSDDSYVEQIGVSPQLITNFRDFFKTIKGVQGGNASFGIEYIPNPDQSQQDLQPTIGRCFLEDLSYVYRKSIGTLDVGKIGPPDAPISIKPAIDLLGNKILAGYKDNQYSQLNGYNEVNSTQNYITPLLMQQNEIDLQCVYRADPYGIEEIRVSQNDTAASRSDNDTFMVWKKPNPENVTPIGDIGYYYHPLRGEGLMTNPNTGEPMISGADVSYYNWMLSPKRNLLRGGNYLASIFYNLKGYKITLASALKNVNLITTDVNGVRVAEAEPISVSNLPKPLFIPMYATFKPGLKKDALYMIDSVPYGFISFTYRSKVYKIFASEISVNVGQYSEQEFKGLFTPDNDLSTLIH